ncbi:hypothetical protein V2P24_01085 [Mycoplasma putrefaciens]|uniref:Mbov_0399 family ICE element protein n=1 Tax=Mycoplasma putrefaciens TaxID=2123 RepID=UPI003DA4782F
MNKNIFLLPSTILASPLLTAYSVLTNSDSINDNLSRSRYYDFPDKYLQTSTRYEEKEFSSEISLNDDTKMWLPNINGWSSGELDDIFPINKKYHNWKLTNTSIREGQYIDDIIDGGIIWVSGSGTANGIELRLNSNSTSNMLSQIRDNLQNNKDDVAQRVQNIFNSLSTNDIYGITVDLKAEDYSLNLSQARFSGRYTWTVSDNDPSLKRIVVHFKYREPVTVFDKRRDYQNSWNKWRNEILASRSYLTIDSDTGGNLETQLDAEQRIKKFKTNREFLDETIAKLNQQANNNLTLQYEQTSTDLISLYLTCDSFREKLAENIRINLNPTKKYQIQEIHKRLTISLGKWVDFNNHTTRLVDDVLVQDPSVKIVENGQNLNAGKWIAHAPLGVSFNALKDETEIVKINGKRIDVLNQKFETTLRDNRKDSKDNEREYDYGYQPKEEDTKTSENSHAKNEYKIEIIKYKPNTGNKVIEFSWKKTLVIESHSSEMDFKWYAWDPEQNPHQKSLIEKFERDQDGEIKKDSNGNPVKNPKYDPKIDPKTGTKKELVWFDFNTHKPWDDSKITSSDKNYYKITHLPDKSKTLFAPHTDESDLDRGVIMEAVVIGKGALREISDNVKGYRVHRLDKTGQFIAVEEDKFTKEFKNGASENSYYSTEGIWLFASETDKAITNFKIVYITDKENPDGYFTDYVTQSANTIKSLWQTKQGREFNNYLLNNKMKQDEILSLKYEEAMEHYKQYINYLYLKDEWERHLEISPKFKVFNEQITTNEFENNYIKKPKVFETKYLDDFKYKNLVNISKIEFNQDKTGIYVYFKLKTNEAKYYLSASKYFLPIKFKDINLANKQTINLNVDSEYIYRVAKQNTRTDFLSKIELNKLFKNQKDELAKLEVSTTFNGLNNKLTINTNLKDQYKGLYVIQPTNSFSLIVDKFKDQSTNSKDKNIFENIRLKNINLGGIEDIHKAKEFIKNKLKQAIPSLTLDKDYAIRNLDIVVEKLKHAQTSISETNPIRYETLILEAISPRFGRTTVNIANTINRRLAKDFDLAKKKLSNITVNENKLSKLRKTIIEKIDQQFKNDDLELGLDLQITNLEQGLAILSQGKGSEFVFNISGLNNYRILNSTSVKVRNNAKFVVDDEDRNYKPGDENNPEKAILYDLSIINLELSFTDHIASELRQKIVDEIKRELANKYSLTHQKHYSFNIDELNLIVKELIKKNDITNTNMVKLYPIAGITKNIASIRINNTNKFFDPVDDTDKPIQDSEAIAASKKRLLLIYIPLAIFGFSSTGLLGWFIYMRKFRKKIT